MDKISFCITKKFIHVDKDTILEAEIEVIHVAGDNGKKENNMAALKKRLTDLKLRISDLADKVMNNGTMGLTNSLQTP